MPIVDEANKSEIKSDLIPGVCRLAFKAPVFWNDDPALWFAHVESQFVVAGISVDSTKFHAVVAALDCKVLKCVRDIIVKPPPEKAYEVLKERVLNFYERSEGSKLSLLLNDLHLGDQRPSQLLCEMESLNGGRLNETALRALWMQRLPLNVQQILSVCTDENLVLSKLAKIADRVCESARADPGVSRVEDVSSVDSLRADIVELKNAFKNLSSEVGSRDFRERKNSGKFFRPRSRSGSRSRDLCWYHNRFGERAVKCVPPCKWQGNEQTRLPRRQ